MSHTFADFFCGIGGVRLGFETADKSFHCVFSNEIDKNAIKTYESNFPDKVNSKSITELDPKEIPDFDVFVGGFPCQSFSIAGNRKGLEDPRGNLFFEIIRIIQEKKPKAFLLENVKNLKTHDKGRTFKIIKNSLCREGYYFKSKIMNSCEYGNVPQNRERIYMVGFRDKEKAEKFKFPGKIVLTKRMTNMLCPNVPEKYYYTEESSIYPILEKSVTKKIDTNQVYQYRRIYVRENKSGICPCMTRTMGTGGSNVPIILDDTGIRKLTPRECFSLQAFPRSFVLPKISDSQLYMQIGNSVTVKVIQRIAKEMLKVL